MNFDTNTFNRIISERRSIFPKDYTGERIDDNIIKQVLENANWAPTHKRTEPWRFVVYTGEGLKKLAQQQAACYKAMTETNGSFKEERYQNLLKKPMESSHIIAIGMKRDRLNTIPEIEEVGAVFCAIQNMYLTATAYNLGCYLSTGGITYFEAAKEIFGLSATDKLLGFLHLGIPKNYPAGKRNPIEEKVTWINQ